MNNFENTLTEFYNNFGTHKEMVLSTSLNDRVSSRMVSVVLINNVFYYQTDRKLKKYNQIQINKNVALCIDNISIEGICSEVGVPIDNDEFSKLYKEFYPNAYEMYSELDDEVLFIVQPKFIQKWIYENNKPFIETWDFETKEYKKIPYIK